MSAPFHWNSSDQRLRTYILWTALRRELYHRAVERGDHRRNWKQLPADLAGHLRAVGVKP